MTTITPEQITGISEQAREVSFARVLVTLIASVFYVIGWLPGKLWLGVVFCALLVRQGWRDAQGRQVTTPEQPPSP